MTPEQFASHLAQMQLDFKDYVNDILPEILANEAVLMFKENFQDESFFGEKWQEVQRRNAGTKTYKYATQADRNRKILTGRTGNLGRSIKVKEVGNGTATIISDLPYSDAHNSGTTTAGRGRGTTIAQRKFIGDHPKLQQALTDIINDEIDRIINS
ncbi:MAG: hypothetical protein LBS50_10675 [Prevotellaceae bacterium]|nr:hypothetical protein [Prevotellaceae bacterium]